jgi:hypothetical protein
MSALPQTFGELQLLEANGYRFSFDAGLHRYVLEGGRQIVSVTQALKLAGYCFDYSRVDRFVLERKKQMGIAFHAATHYADDGDLDPDSIAPEIQPRLAAYERAVEYYKLRPIKREYRAIGCIRGMLFAGTTDFEGLIRPSPMAADELAIIDWKLIENPHLSWGPQTAAYNEMLGVPNWAEVLKKFSNAKFRSYPKRRSRFTLQFLNSGDFHLEPHTDEGDYESFSACLWIANDLVRRGKRIEETEFLVEEL